MRSAEFEKSATSPLSKQIRDFVGGRAETVPTIVPASSGSLQLSDAIESDFLMGVSIGDDVLDQ